MFYTLDVKKLFFALATKVFSFFFLLLLYVQAQAVTLTVAQAFKVALDLWEIAQEGESVVIILESTEGNQHARTVPLNVPLFFRIKMLCLFISLSEPEGLTCKC